MRADAPRKTVIIPVIHDKIQRDESDLEFAPVEDFRLIVRMVNLREYDKQM
jgi:hypothetical protein